MAIDLKAEREELLKRKIEEDKKTGAKMREKREAKGKKASWVAAEMGVSPPYISDLENGRRHWHPHLIEAYEKAIAK